MRRRVKVRIGIVWLIALAASALMNSQYRFTKQKDSLCKIDIDALNICNISEEVSPTPTSTPRLHRPACVQTRYPGSNVLYLVFMFLLPISLIFTFYCFILRTLNGPQRSSCADIPSNSKIGAHACVCTHVARAVGTDMEMREYLITMPADVRVGAAANGEPLSTSDPSVTKKTGTVQTSVRATNRCACTYTAHGMCAV
jgi:hypothetical protein